MGVGLIKSDNAALLVAIFVSNLPEAIVGAEKMAESGIGRHRIMIIWIVTAVALSLAVLVGTARSAVLTTRRSRGRWASPPARCSPRSPTR